MTKDLIGTDENHITDKEYEDSLIERLHYQETFIGNDNKVMGD